MNSIASSGVVLLLLAGGVSGPAFDQPDSKSLEKRWSEQNAVCLNGEMEWEGPSTARIRAACAKRNAIMGQLRDLNRCYGRRQGIGYVMEWHDCAPDSATYDLPPPLRRAL